MDETTWRLRSAEPMSGFNPDEIDGERKWLRWYAAQQTLKKAAFDKRLQLPRRKSRPARKGSRLEFRQIELSGYREGDFTSLSLRTLAS